MKETDDKYLIYKAFNQKTGQMYIGATTDSLHQRKLDHTERATRGESNKFHDAISTYGSEFFLWEQLDTANSLDELAKKEQSYIIKYRTKEEGYNSSIGGEFKKTVYQYDLKDGSLIGKYDCLQNAASVISARKNAISRACLSVNKIYRGYFWSYDYEEPFKPNKDIRKKKVLHYNLEVNTVHEYDSVADASRKTGVSKSCIAKFCRGERNPPEGVIWEYE
tara:strand:- start:127 stop:789 length:663 start_codon:yes stop_codon:yes gene_type:complete